MSSLTGCQSAKRMIRFLFFVICFSQLTAGCYGADDAKWYLGRWERRHREEHVFLGVLNEVYTLGISTTALDRIHRSRVLSEPESKEQETHKYLEVSYSDTQVILVLDSTEKMEIKKIRPHKISVRVGKEVSEYESATADFDKPLPMS